MAFREKQRPRAERLFVDRWHRFLAPSGFGWAARARAELAGSLTGDVLEIGPGAGADPRHFRSASKDAESLPFADDRFDAVVSSLALCTVGDQARALAEIRRVVRPGGRLVFLEHVRSRGAAGRAQDWLTPLACRVTGGCRPNRDTRAALMEAGFVLHRVETFKPVPRVPLVAPFIRGVAAMPDPQWERELRWLSGEGIRP